MSKRKEMIQLFDSISKFNTYSKYSNSLKKIFKNKSLKDYIKLLKNPIHVDSFQFVIDFDKRTKKNGEEDDEHNLLPKHFLKKGKELDLLHEENIPSQEENNENKEKEKTKTFTENKSVKSLTNFRQELDPFKYNPNYNSIYKNVPSFKMIIPKSKLLFKKHAKSQAFLTSVNNKKSKNLKININDESKNKNNSSKNDSLNSSDNNIKSRNYKTLPELNSSHNKIKNKNIKMHKNKYNHNNHAFRFSKYIPRKMNIYNVNKRLTYLEPYHYSTSDKISKALDFNKMENRDSNKWFNLDSITNPSFYYYTPKYDSIEKKPIKILFNPKEFYKNNKKYLIKKIWASYNVKKEYESIDNDKLLKKCK